ncbi:uncharacterized protein LOC101859236 isoform X2 [Aplysia californica]|uniref:separase n=1 Tax=Aplysia californica TaxID=6500 RepID=A0ABM0ZXL3_APLCA|nr:uncharacterized protein LOC101859236 isoform X2 [Aplysia californica]
MVVQNTDPNIQEFLDSASAVQKELETACKVPGSSVNFEVFQKLLLRSGNFLSHFKDDKGEDIGFTLSAWYDLATKALLTLFQCRADLDSGPLKMRLLLSYLNHISYHLINIKDVPLEWHRYFGMVALEFLSEYSMDPTYSADFLTSLAEKFNAFLCTVGKRVQTAPPSGKTGERLGQYYQLYLLGAAFQSLIPGTNDPNQNGKPDSFYFLRNYLQALDAVSNRKNSPGGGPSTAKTSCSVWESEKEFAPWLLRFAVSGVTLSTPQASEDDYLLFCVYLFQLCYRTSPKQFEELLQSECNLFIFDVASESFGFPDDGTRRRRKSNLNRQFCKLKEFSGFGTVMQAVKIWRKVSTYGPFPLPPGVKTDKASGFWATSAEVMADLKMMEELIRNQSSGGCAPPLSVGRAMSALLLSLPSPKVQDCERALHLSWFGLTSVAVELLCRDVLTLFSMKTEHPSLRQRTYSLAMVNKIRVPMLSAVLGDSKMSTSDLQLVAEYLKLVLSAQCSMVRHCRDSSQAKSCPALYSVVTKTLEATAQMLGFVGKSLCRSHRYEEVTTLLCPLWPVVDVAEMLPSVSHHEVLAESYRKMKQFKQMAWVISEAARIDTSLLSIPVMRTLSKAAYETRTFYILDIFEPLKANCSLHFEFVNKILMWILVGSDSLASHHHLMALLPCLKTHSGASKLDQGLTMVTFAEVLWNDTTLNSSNLPVHILNTIGTAIGILELEDVSHEWDDRLAQAFSLFWAIIKHHHSILQLTDDSEGDFGKRNDLFAKKSISAVAVEQRAVISPNELITSALVDEDHILSYQYRSLLLWTEWFGRNGDVAIKGKEFLCQLRAARSILFLQRVANLFLLHHRNLWAIQALSQLVLVAELRQDTAAAEEARLSLLTLAAEEGLELVCQKDMSSLAPSGSSHVKHQARAAQYYLRSGQLREFVKVTNTALKTIATLREGGPLTPAVTSALSLILRLRADYLCHPEIVRQDSLAEEESDNALGNCPLQDIGESLKYLCSLAAYYGGLDSRSVTSFKVADGMTGELWGLLPDYLATLRVAGDLYLRVGLYKYARSQYKEGLVLSQLCTLSTWTMVFAAKMSEVSLLIWDVTRSAADFLLHSSFAVGDQNSKLETFKVGDITVNDRLVPLRHLAVSCTSKTKHVCDKSFVKASEDLETVRTNLLRGLDVYGFVSLLKNSVAVVSTCASSPFRTAPSNPPVHAFCHSSVCCKCINPETVRATADALCSQGEIMRRNCVDQRATLESFYAAMCTACQLKTHQRKEVQGEVVKTGIQLKHCSQLKKLTLSPTGRLAEYCLHCLIIRSPVMCKRDLKKLLDTIVVDCGNATHLEYGSVTFAYAQMLAVAMKYVEEGQKWSEEFIPQWIAEEEFVIFKNLILELKSWKFHWDLERKMKLTFADNEEERIADTHPSTPRKKSADSSGGIGRCVVGKKGRPAVRKKISSSVRKMVSKKQVPESDGNKISEDEPEGGNGSRAESCNLLSSVYDADNIGRDSPVMEKKRRLGLENARQVPLKTTPISRKTKCGSRKKENLGKSSPTVENGVSLSPLSQQLDENQFATDLSSDQVPIVRPQRRRGRPKANSTEGSKASGTSAMSVLKQHKELMQRLKNDAGSGEEEGSVKTKTSERKAKPGASKRTSSRRCGKVSELPVSEPQEVNLSSDVKVIKKSDTGEGEENIIPGTPEPKSPAVKRGRRKGVVKEKDETGSAAAPVVKLSVRARGRPRKAAKASESPETNRERGEEEKSFDECLVDDSMDNLEASVCQDSFIEEKSTEFDFEYLTSVDNPEETESSCVQSDSFLTVHMANSSSVISRELPVPLEEDFKGLSPEILRGRPQRRKLITNAVDGKKREDNDGESREISRGRVNPPKDESNQRPGHSGESAKSEASKPESGEDKEEAEKESMSGTNNKNLASKSKLSVRKPGDGNLKKADGTEKDPTESKMDEQTGAEGRKEKADRRKKMNSTTRVDLSPERNPVGGLSEQLNEMKIETDKRDHNGERSSSRAHHTLRNECPEESGSVISLTLGEFLLKNPNFCEECVKAYDEVTIAVFNVQLSELGINKFQEMEDEESLPMRFSSLHLAGNDDDRFETLQKAFDQLKHLPPCYLYTQICQGMAMCLWENDLHRWSNAEPMDTCIDASRSSQKQVAIAAYLTESLAISYRHQMNRNLRSKLKKMSATPAAPSQPGGVPQSNSDWDNLGSDLAAEAERMSRAVNALKFSGDPEHELMDRLKALPADWTVVQISQVNFDPFEPDWGQVLVTRMTSDLQPVTVGVPMLRMKYLRSCLNMLKEVLKGIADPETASCALWDKRRKLNDYMIAMVPVLEEKFMEGHKWLLQGQPLWIRQSEAEGELDEAAEIAVKAVKELHKVTVEFGTVRALLPVLMKANSSDIASLLLCLWPPPVTQTLIYHVLALQKNMQPFMMRCQSEMGDLPSGPVVLVLDKYLSKLPWESTLGLAPCVVTRMPSLCTLQALLCLHKDKAESAYMTGVDRDSTVAVVDPETNLPNTMNTLVPEFAQYPGWKCVSQIQPTVENLKSFLMDQALYIYAGHGWGKQFVGGDDLQMFRSRAVAVLMGCQSAYLRVEPKMEGDGAPLYFLMAGCPAVVGNLWIVTDKDADKVTCAMVSHWMSQKEAVPLSSLLTAARPVCKLSGLNGYPLVTYGLPVMMNGPKRTSS